MALLKRASRYLTSAESRLGSGFHHTAQMNMNPTGNSSAGSTPTWLQAARDQWTNRGEQRPSFAIEPEPGQESVWDYPRPPLVVPDQRLVEVRVGDRLVASTNAAVRVLETSHPPSFYRPNIWGCYQMALRSDGGTPPRIPTSRCGRAMSRSIPTEPSVGLTGNEFERKLAASTAGGSPTRSSDRSKAKQEPPAGKRHLPKCGSHDLHRPLPRQHFERFLSFLG